MVARIPRTQLSTSSTLILPAPSLSYSLQTSSNLEISNWYLPDLSSLMTLLDSSDNTILWHAVSAMFLLLLIPLRVAALADNPPQRPPGLLTLTTKPSTNTPSHPTASPKVSWFWGNYTANYTGPTIQRNPTSSRDPVSPTVDLDINFSQVIEFFSTTRFPGGGATDASPVQEHSSTARGPQETVPPSDDAARTVAGITTSSDSPAPAGDSSPGVSSTGSGDRTTKYMGHDSNDDERDNRTSVCVFGEADPRIFDVVVYLTVDMAISALALILGGIQLFIWYRTKDGRLTNRTWLEGVWHLTYSTCCLIVMVSSLLYWIGAKFTFPLDLLLLCAHLLRTKAAQLLLAKIFLSWKRLSCVAGALLFFLDIAWFSLSFSLTGIILEGCRFCQRSLLSRDCVANNVIDFIGICGGTVVYCGVKTAGLLTQKALKHSKKLYSQIPKNSSYIVNVSNGGVADSELNLRLQLKRCQHLIPRISMLFLMSHQVLSCLFIFGIFPSDF